MKRVICTLVMVVMLFSSFGGMIYVQAAENTYYVDSVSGSDSNSGLSTTAAWKTLSKVNATTFAPGDKILFKSGCSWSGQLNPKGSGSSTSPIVIDMYGGTTKPIINGGGVEAAVYLFNQQYWEINNLEVTNIADPTTGYRRGVYVVAQDIGTCEHIYIRNVYVHDVRSNPDSDGTQNALCTGGIMFRVLGSSVPTKFNDFKVENCTVVNVDLRGIYCRSTWLNRDGCVEGYGNWYGFTNVVVRNNTVDNTYTGGLVLAACQSPLVEYNTVSRAAQNGGNVAIWSWNSDDAVYQYNEAYLTLNGDGQGYDIDGWCNRNIFQYNYSHDNAGGFIFFCGARKDNIFRYNISQNDGRRIFMFAGTVPENCQIYNNTIYVAPNKTTPIVALQSFKIPTSVYFKNNIIYNLGAGGYCDLTNMYFENNCFYGNHPDSEPNDPKKITDDPRFVNAGGGGTGRSTCDAYKLTQYSPCIGTGVSISGNGGKDFWGNSLYYGNPDIGAHEFQGTYVIPSPTPTPANLAFRKTVGASSSGNIDRTAVRAFDGNTGTMWQSISDNTQWIYVDMWASYSVNRVILRWNGTYAKSYSIQLSQDGLNWSNAFSTTTGNGGVDDVSIAASSARYVRMYATVRSSTSSGYSLGEMEVYGNGGGSTPTPTPTPTLTPTPTPVPGTEWYSTLSYSAGVHSLGSSNTGTRTVEFDVIPLSSGIDGFAGYTDSSTVIDDYSDYSMQIRMNTSGRFDVRNGGSFMASSTVAYTANSQYHVKMVTNLSAKTYSVWVTPPGGSAIQIASNYAFRTGSSAIDDLGKIGLKSLVDNEFKLKNHTVQ